MPILYASKGLPGSGKSTAARKFLDANPDVVRVNRDEIRFMLHGRYWPADEALVTVIQHTAIRAALEAGLDVYSDDTNLSPIAQQGLQVVATSVSGTKIVWHDHTDVPLAVCIERDAHRERHVGAKVIRDMWERYLA